MDALAHRRTYNGWRIGKTICWICKKAVPTTLAKMGDGVCHRCQKKYFMWPSKALREVKNAARKIH
jgi:hypothetical protein